MVAACGSGGGGSASGNSVSTPPPAGISDDKALKTSSLKASSAGNMPIGFAARDDFVANGLNHAIAAKHFSELTAENTMKMRFLHPAENTFTFATGDAYVNYAKANNMTVHGHTLIWHSDYQMPDFMKKYQGGKNEYLAMLKNHVTTIVSHFAGRVKSWDVVNEALDDNGGFRNSVFYQKTGTDFIDQAFINARNADPAADLYYNDYSTDQGGVKFNAMKTMIDGLVARKVPITGVGFQMHITLDFPTTDTLRTVFKSVVDRGLKVKLTELDIPLNNPYGARGFTYSSFTAASASAQRKRYCEVIKAYLETVPANLRGGISVWGIRDPESWLLQLPEWKGNPDWPLLFDASGNKKPALDGFRTALESQPCS